MVFCNKITFSRDTFLLGNININNVIVVYQVTIVVDRVTIVVNRVTYLPDKYYISYLHLLQTSQF